MSFSQWRSIYGIRYTIYVSWTLPVVKSKRVFTPQQRNATVLWLLISIAAKTGHMWTLTTFSLKSCDLILFWKCLPRLWERRHEKWLLSWSCQDASDWARSLSWGPTMTSSQWAISWRILLLHGMDTHWTSALWLSMSALVSNLHIGPQKTCRKTLQIWSCLVYQATGSVPVKNSGKIWEVSHPVQRWWLPRFWRRWIHHGSTVARSSLLQTIENNAILRWFDQPMPARLHGRSDSPNPLEDLLTSDLTSNITVAGNFFVGSVNLGCQTSSTSGFPSLNPHLQESWKFGSEMDGNHPIPPISAW